MKEKAQIVIEWLTSFGKTEGAIERWIIFPVFMIISFKYAPASLHWLINSIIVLWLVVMTWKLVTLLRGKEWQ